MLGELSKRKRKKLEESGTRATATVVSIAEKGMTMTSGNDQIVANTKVILKTKLSVEPEGQPAFEIEEKFRYSQFGIPSAGDKLPVIFDPEDHDTIMLDDNPEAAIDAAISGMGMDPAKADLAKNLVNGQLQGVPMADLQAMAAQFGQQQYRTPATGIPASGMPQAGSIPGFPAAAAPAPAAADPVEQLTKLSELKDKGVLTDAEFAEQKAKILGS